MFGQSNEKKALRGSCFVNPSMNSMIRPKRKKNIFSKPSTCDLSDFDDRRYHETKAGDSNENMVKADMNFFKTNKVDMKGNKTNYLESKKSKTFVVDKKIYKSGYFAKLKKKNQEELNRLFDQRSKDVDIIQIKTSIEKIQEKIGELSKAIDLKSSTYNHQQETKKVVDSRNSSDSKKKFKASATKVMKALAAVGIMFIVILLLLYFVEGKHFFSSVWSPNSFKLSLKSTKSKSWFGNF